MKTLTLTFALTLSVLPGLQATTLSDNLSAQTEYTELIYGGNWIAAGFATDASPYVLTSVTALLKTDTSGPVTMSLYTNSSSGPTTDLGTLLSPTSIDSSSLSPAIFGGNSLQLSPNSVYWLVLSASGTGTYEWAYAADNTGSGPGFIHTWGTSSDAGATWFTSDLQPMQMRVDASATTATPEPAAWSLLLIGAAIFAVFRQR